MEGLRAETALVQQRRGVVQVFQVVQVVLLVVVVQVVLGTMVDDVALVEVVVAAGRTTTAGVEQLLSVMRRWR